MTTPLLHSIQSSTRILGIGRSSLYGLIAEGQIRIVKIGRRTLIPDLEIRRYDETLSKHHDGTTLAGAGE